MTAPTLRLVSQRDEKPDPRVTAVLEVLAGAPRAEVAHRWSVDVAVLHRWVRDFVAAGSAQVTHRPDPQAARQRDRFLAAFAHEMRTPLATALGWAALLVDGDLALDTAAFGLGRLHEALVTLSARTVDVELLTAASLGCLAPRLTPVALVDLVAAADRSDAPVTAGLPSTPVSPRLGPAVRAPDVPADVDAAPDAAPDVAPDAAPDVTPDVVLEVDLELTARILGDLWRAAHLGPEPDDVHLEHSVVGPWHELRVVRDGDPVPVPQLQALFDPFDLNHDGTGITIGLYLARALAVTQGGAIGVEQDDRRTALWVRLPLSAHGSTHHHDHEAGTDPPGGGPS